MKFTDTLRRWGMVISLVLFSIVYASLQWDVLQGLATDGITTIDTLYEAGLFVMLLITISAAIYGAYQTASHEPDL